MRFSALSLSIIVFPGACAPTLPDCLLLSERRHTRLGLQAAVATIGSVFGGYRNPPVPHWPQVTMTRIQELLPSAFTIAFLSSLESLLCAVVADGMTGRRHRSNCELVGQGIANFCSALFGGMPATGTMPALPLTSVLAQNRRWPGFYMPSLFCFACWLLPPSPPISRSPASARCWSSWRGNSEREKFHMLMRGARDDSLVLLATFGLTSLSTCRQPLKRVWSWRHSCSCTGWRRRWKCRPARRCPNPRSTI